MGKRWLVGVLAGWLAGFPPASAEDPLPLNYFAALRPPTTAEPPERPSELPNIDPRLDLRPLVRPPAATPEPKRVPLRERLFGPDYDPSYLFLPERNPGVRQPPCPCLPLGTYWVNTAYFLGKTQNDTVPPVVTSGGTGILGAPGVSLLHGNDHLEHPFRSGLRIEMGAWLDRCQNWGIDGSFFVMQSTATNFQNASTGNPLLGRPYIDATTNQPAVDVLAAPGLSRGSISLNSPLTFLGADVNSRHTLFCEDNRRIDFLAGYRVTRMSEQLSIQSHSESVNGTVRDVLDNYRTVNLFNGGQVGLAGEIRFDHLYLSGAMKTAFGVNWNSLAVSGNTQTQSPGSNVISPGGLLTSRVMGTKNERNFAVVPEANFTAGYQVTENWRAYVGYTFVYISSVARPGQAVDLGGQSRNDANTDFWMHGINLGIEARY